MELDDGAQELQDLDDRIDLPRNQWDLVPTAIPPLPALADIETDYKTPWDPLQDPPIRAAAAADPNFPFRVILKKIGGNWKRGVYFESHLLTDYPVDSTKTITGLLTTTKPSSGDAGWATVTTTDKIWLEGDIDDSSTFPFTIGDCSIKSLGAGDTFDGGEFENDGGDGGTPVTYSQTKFRKVLATTKTGDSGAPAIDLQLVRTDLLIQQGKLALHSKDSSAGSDEPILAAYPVPI